MRGIFIGAGGYIYILGDLNIAIASCAVLYVLFFRNHGRYFRNHGRYLNINASLAVYNFMDNFLVSVAKT